MLGFEESYVLESKDGLAYTSATPIEHTQSPEEVLARQRREREEQRKNLSLKSLREQLRDNAERADAEWKEKHNPFLPPKSLDGEEVDWLSEEELKRKEKERLRKMQEEQDRIQFELAVAKREEEEAKAAQHKQGAAGTAQGTAAAATSSDASPFSFKGSADSSTAAALPSSIHLPSLLPVVRIKRKDAPPPPADPHSEIKKLKPQTDAAPRPAPVLSSLLAYSDDDDD